MIPFRCCSASHRHLKKNFEESFVLVNFVQPCQHILIACQVNYHRGLQYPKHSSHRAFTGTASCMYLLTVLSRQWSAGNRKKFRLCLVEVTNERIWYQTLFNFFPQSSRKTSILFPFLHLQVCGV